VASPVKQHHQYILFTVKNNITSPIKDYTFPDDEDDELPMSAEQAEKAEAEMKMKNKILRCCAPYEAEKFEAAMRSTIKTFEPYSDDDNLEVLRETSEDSCIRYLK
jgi:hypothetical protein